MVFAGLNYAAIVVAAIVAFAAGAVWYGLLGKHWLAALGKGRDDIRPSPAPFITAGVAELVMAWILAGVIGHLGEITIRSGVVAGAFLWLGFVATTIAVNHAYQAESWKLTFIDAGHWLVVLVLMGGVIGAFGA